MRTQKQGREFRPCFCVYDSFNRLKTAFNIATITELFP